MKTTFLALTALVISAGSLAAGDKSLMHCFAFTVVDAATPADWTAWEAATDKLPKEIPGLTHVWHGKLASPLGQTQIALPDGQQPEITARKTG